jgi:hypothetical protein
MNRLALFKHNYVGTCILQPHKSNRVWPCTFLFAFVEVCICLLPLPTFHMSQYHGGWSHYMSRWLFIEHSCSTLNAPTFCIHVNQATPHKDFRLTTTWSLSAHKLAHALITWTKVNFSGIIPSHCICWKSCITFSGRPSFKYFVSIWFHAKISISLCLVPSQPCLFPPMVGFVSPQARVLVSSCVWNPDNFHLSTTRNPDQAHQPCILHIPGISGIKRTEAVELTFSISILHLLTFSSLLLYPTSVKDLKRFFAKFRVQTRAG